MTRPTVAIVVNPVAGIGGPAGLKGSDGADVQDAARRRGARSHAQERAVRTLTEVASHASGLRLVTASGSMGADAAAAAGMSADIGWHPGAHVTTGADTTAACRALVDAGAELVLFAGGDGTARDVHAGVGDRAAVLGIPCGVKMYSSCFAVSPRAAGAVVAAWASGDRIDFDEREVLDIDEDAVRAGRVEPRLHGLVRVPVWRGRTQARKAATPASEREAVQCAARGVIEAMHSGVTYLLGPGGTTAQVARLLGVEPTPLGVDVVRDGELIAADADHAQLLDAVTGRPARAVVSVIGGQGFVLGRGNQQLSPEVLRAMGDDPLLIMATEDKLVALGGRPLLVDTGDVELDQSLAGHARVITAPGATSIYPIQAPEVQGD